MILLYEFIERANAPVVPTRVPRRNKKGLRKSSYHALSPHLCHNENFACPVEVFFSLCSSFGSPKRIMFLYSNQSKTS